MKKTLTLTLALLMALCCLSPAVYAETSDASVSARDASGDYDAATAVTLSPGSDLTITAAGTYILSGAYTNQMVMVAVGKEDKVQLVLDNAELTNANGPAIYIRSADKVFLTAAAGTVNTISDGAGGGLHGVNAVAGLDALDEVALAGVVGGIDEIHAGLVQRHGVEGGQHADVGQYRRVVLVVAVAVGRDVHDEADVEAGPPVADGQRVLRHLAAEHLICRIRDIMDRIKGACTYAAPTAFTKIGIDICFMMFHVSDGIASAFFGTTSATPADILFHNGKPVIMLLHLSCTAASAHSDVFDCASETSTFMALEMGQRDQDICIH